MFSLYIFSSSFPHIHSQHKSITLYNFGPRVIYQSSFTISVFYLHIQLHMSVILYTNIDQTFVNSLHRLLNCEIGGLDFRVITTEYISRVFEYTYNTYFVRHCPCNLFGSIWSMFSYNTLNISIQQTI